MFEHLINLSFNKNSLAPCVYAAVLISIKKKLKKELFTIWLSIHFALALIMEIMSSRKQIVIWWKGHL